MKNTGKIGVVYKAFHYENGYTYYFTLKSKNIADFYIYRKGDIELEKSSTHNGHGRDGNFTFIKEENIKEASSEEIEWFLACKEKKSYIDYIPKPIIKYEIY